MSNHNKFGVFLVLGVAWITAAHGAAGMHAIQATNAQNDRGIVELKRDASAAPHAKSLEGRKKMTGSRLRCWQHGKLIYETRDAMLATDSKVASVETQGSGMQNVQVMDMNHGLCILESAPAQAKQRALR